MAATDIDVVPARSGRENQRYDDAGRRLVAGGVVLRHVDRADPEVLLISSTRKANTWVIPKGGWERDETSSEAAVREVQEEGGVEAEVLQPLGTFDITSEKGNETVWTMYLMKEVRFLESWAEMGVRERKYVKLSEAVDVARAQVHPILEAAKAVSL